MNWWNVIKEGGGISFGTGNGALHGRSYGGKKNGKEEEDKENKEE